MDFEMPKLLNKEELIDFKNWYPIEDRISDILLAEFTNLELKPIKVRKADLLRGFEIFKSIASVVRPEIL